MCCPLSLQVHRLFAALLSDPSSAAFYVSGAQPSPAPWDPQGPDLGPEPPAASSSWSKFSFLTTWPTLPAGRKAALYSRHACRELQFWLCMRDPEFFQVGRKGRKGEGGRRGPRGRAGPGCVDSVGQGRWGGEAGRQRGKGDLMTCPWARVHPSVCWWFVVLGGRSKCEGMAACPLVGNTYSPASLGLRALLCVLCCERRLPCCRCCGRGWTRSAPSWTTGCWACGARSWALSGGCPTSEPRSCTPPQPTPLHHTHTHTCMCGRRVDTIELSFTKPAPCLVPDCVQRLSTAHVESWTRGGEELHCCLSTK